MSDNHPLWAARSTDPALSDLHERLSVDSTAVGTKDFLRPVFKWLKFGSRHYDPEKAFQLAEWVVAATSTGDEAIGVPPLRQLQPSYVFNTIVTMSQRNNRPADAQRAHARMLRHGLEPDIFTLTALIDVVGRSGDIEEAYRVYDTMLDSEHTLPNVVTYCTLLRLTSKHLGPAEGAPRVRRLLGDARRLARRPTGSQVSDQDGVVDSSIYNAALAASVRYLDEGLLEHVLGLMRDGALEPLSPLTYEIVCKFAMKHCEDRGGDPAALEALLGDLLARGVLSASDVTEVKTHMVSRRARGQTGGLAPPTVTQQRLLYNISGAGPTAKPVKRSACGYVENMSYLGPKSPASLRATVLSHDLTRLAQRLQTPQNAAGAGPSTGPDPDTGAAVALCESDFVTIIHQCRKRKWFEEVDTVLRFMRALCLDGLPEVGLPPAPSVRVSMLSVEAAMESYFAGGLVALAWGLFETVCLHVNAHSEASDPSMDISAGEGIMSFTSRFPTLVISGFIGCMSYEHAARAFLSFRRAGDVPPSASLVQGMLRAAGRSRLCAQAALSLLAGLTAEATERKPAADSLASLSLRPVYEDFKSRWFCGPEAASSGRGQRVLSWEDLETCLQTLLRACALLSGAALAADLAHFLCGLSCQDSEAPSCYFELVDGSEPLAEWAYWHSLIPTDAYARSMRCLSECLRGLLLRWDSHYMTSLLMGPCSESVCAREICASILDMQRRRLLPPLACLHSLALEALGHSWAPDKKTAVVFEAKKGEGSLPFRSFVLIGVLKYLDERSHLLDAVVTQVYEGGEQESASSGLFVYMGAADWVDGLALAFGAESPSDAALVTACADPVLRALLQGVGGLVDEPVRVPTDCALSAAGGALFEGCQLQALLFLQHAYARFSNVKTKDGKERLEQDLSFVFAEYLGSFRALWNFTCALITKVHMIGSKADEKVIIRFFSFMLSLLSTDLQQRSDSTGGVTAVAAAVEGKGKKASESSGSVSFIFSDSGLDSPVRVLSACLVAMVQNAIDCGRGPFDYLKTAHKCFAVMSYEEFCRDIAQYLSHDIHTASEKPLRLSQIVDFVISFRACLAAYLDTGRLEALLAEHLHRDAGYYKSAVEYVCHMAAPLGCPESGPGAAVALRWEACVRIVHMLLSAREAALAGGISTELLERCSNAVVVDVSVKLLFKLHPATQEARRDSRAAGERRADADAVLAAHAALAEYVRTDDKSDRSALPGPTEGSTEGSGIALVGEGPYFELPVEREQVIVVSSSGGVALAAKTLCGRAGVGVVGIDAEWRPMGKYGGFHKCSLLQIACRSHVFLFDLVALEPSFGEPGSDYVASADATLGFSELIREIFSSESILKLGYGLKNDLDRLRESFPNSTHYSSVVNSLDLKSHAAAHDPTAGPLDTVGAGRPRTGGLSGLLLSVCGFALDKAMQVSDWEARPLSEEQILYAAKDALCLIYIWDQLHPKNSAL